jgi:hypothetical protein
MPGVTACGNPACARRAPDGDRYCCWPCQNAAGLGHPVPLPPWIEGGTRALMHTAGCQAAQEQPAPVRVWLPGGRRLTRLTRPRRPR